jgi:hypothetical protein
LIPCAVGADTDRNSRLALKSAEGIACSAWRTHAWVAAALFRVSKQHDDGAHIFFRELAASLP